MTKVIKILKIQNFKQRTLLPNSLETHKKPIKRNFWAEWHKTWIRSGRTQIFVRFTFSEPDCYLNNFNDRLNSA